MTDEENTEQTDIAENTGDNADKAQGGNAEEAVGSAEAPSSDSISSGSDAVAPTPSRDDMNAFGDVMVELSAVMGRITMSVEQFLKLGRGAIIELSKHKDDDIDIYANNYHIAQAEIVVESENVGISITKLLKQPKTV